MQATELRDALRAGAQHEMIGVAQHHIGAQGLHLIGIHRLHGAGRTHRHEGWCADDPARHADLARARGSVSLGNGEGELVGAHSDPEGNLHHRQVAENVTGRAKQRRAEWKSEVFYRVSSRNSKLPSPYE